MLLVLSSVLLSVIAITPVRSGIRIPEAQPPPPRPPTYAELWSGDCGLPSLPVSSTAVSWARNRDQQVISDIFSSRYGQQDDIASSMPWMIRIWYPPSQLEGPTGYDGAAALIRARQGHEASDIAITSGYTCHRINYYLRNGYTVWAVFGVHGDLTSGYARVPIGGCSAHDGRLGQPPHWTMKQYDYPAVYHFGVLKLAGAVEFRNVIRPVCMPRPDERIPIDTHGIVADWDATSNNLHTVSLKIVPYSICNGNLDHVICVGAYNENTRIYTNSAIGGPFVTVQRQTGRSVLAGVANLIGNGVVDLPQFMPNVTEYVLSEWVQRKVQELSQFW